MLVASVPMAARTERTAIGRALEMGTSRGAVLIVSQWSAMGPFALIGIGKGGERAVRAARRASYSGTRALSADDALDRDGGGFTATNAKSCNAAFEVLGLQRVQQRDDQPRAGGANGMAERAGAAVDVQLLSGDAEILLRRHRYDGKSFIDLEQIDIAGAPADLVQQLANGRDRCGSEPLWLLAMGGMALDLREHREAVPIGQRAFRQNECRGAVGVRGGGCGRDGAVGAERRFQPGDLGGIDLEWMLVIGDDPRSSLLRQGNRRDLGLERAAFNRLAGARQRLHGVSVLVLAGELISFRGGLAEIAHRAAGLVGVF